MKRQPFHFSVLPLIATAAAVSRTGKLLPDELVEWQLAAEHAGTH